MITSREWTQHILLKSLCSANREAVNAQIIGDLRPEYFTSNLYRKSFRLVKEHYEDTGNFYTWTEFIKLPQLGESNSRKIKALELRRKTLCKTDESLLLPKTKQSYITFFERLQHDAKHVKLVELQNELSDKLDVEMDSESLAPLLDLVRDTINEIDMLRINKGVLFEVSEQTVKDKLKEFYKNLKNRFFIPTGFKDFDDINIGIPLDSLFVMAAPTGCGKSSLLLQYLINAARHGARVCLLPLEMSEEQMLIRLASNLLEIPANELVKDLKKYYKRIIKCITKFLAETEGVIHFYTPDIEETLPETLSKLSMNNYDIIAVDYINLMAQMKSEKWESLDVAGIYAKRFAGKNKTQIVFLAQLDKNTGDTRYSKALMEHACLTGDNLVNTPDGFVRIDDICNKRKRGFYDIERKVINMNNEEEVACKFYVNGIDRVYRMTLYDGRTIYCTKNHKFLVAGYNELQWKRLEDIKCSDFVMKSNYTSFNTKDIYLKNNSYIDKYTEDFAYVLAGILLRGYIDKNQMYIICNTTMNPNYFLTLKSKLISIFGDNFVEESNSYGSYLNCTSSKIIDFLYNLLNEKGNINLPVDLMNCKKEIVASFIRSAFEYSDYYIYGSNRVLRRLQLLLDKFRLDSFIQYKRLRVNNINEVIKVINGECSPSNFIVKPYISSRLNQEVEARNMSFCKISGIQYVGEQQTFDLTVQDTHSYTTSGIICHNSNMWSWNHTLQDIMENQKIDIVQQKARNQNPIPFSLKANLACSRFENYIQDMDNNYQRKRKKAEPLSKGFDAGGSDVPD